MTTREQDREFAEVEARVGVGRRMAGNESAQPPGRAVLADALADYAIQLARRDRMGEALSAARESHQLFQKLNAADAKYLPYFAMAGDVLRSVLGASPGHAREAEAVARGAVEAYRVLVRSDEATYLNRLTTSLAQLGNSLAVLGNRAEAIAVLREAVEIRRRTSPGRDRDLSVADALVSLGIVLGEAGESADQLAAIEEAIGLYRRWDSSGMTGTDLWEYTTALLAWAEALTGAGRAEEAQRQRSEAADLYRRMGSIDGSSEHLAAQLRRFGFDSVGDVLAGRAVPPDAYGSASTERELLARLHELIVAANQRKTDGRLDDARVLFEQAAGVAKRLVDDFSDEHLLDAATSHHDLGIAYSEAGQAEAALEAFEDAVAFYRRTGSTKEWQRAYAGSLTNLGHCLSEQGLVADGIEATLEAVDVLRPLVDDDPVDLTKLALALNNLGTFLVRVDRSGEAVAPAQEAVDLYRRLAATDGHADPFAFARALNNLGEALRKRGRWGRARAAFREAKAVYPG